ncbi:protein Tob2 [Clupea harengus]|uniref:Protein Tob2 n=1 Tax=Clupea harengus TaxID=7950 RepID=A0A8M1KQC0_CLUHA|nr:protein Tob2 [Clupea harengus]
MHLEVKVAINFIVSYLYNKLPRRRADLFGEELEQILLSRFEGHWYCDAPLRGSAYRCLHLGLVRDPVVELAAKRSGLDKEEVRANVPEELAVWIDPHEVSYRLGESGALKVLYLDDPLGLGSEGVMAEEGLLSKGDLDLDEVRSSLGFNPEAQVFVPIGGQMSPVLLPSLSNSPTPLSTSSCHGLYGYSASSTPSAHSAHSSNTSTPSPPSAALPYLQAQPNTRPPPQPITFTTATFAATKFGSTKMKKSSIAGSTVVPGMGVPQPQQQQPQPQMQMLSRSPTTVISPPGLLKHKSLSLSLHSLGGGPMSSQLSPNAKEFVYPSTQGHPLYFDVDTPPTLPPPHTSPFQAAPAHTHPHAHTHTHPSFDPFSSSPPPGQAAVGGIINANAGISFVEKPTFVDGLSGYNLQYPNQAFQPVVLAN